MSGYSVEAPAGIRRKPDPDSRRRELCDAAIELLAEDGVKGLSHLKVDRRLGLPDGTTSFYFRTRSALVHASARRVAERDLSELTAATELQSNAVPGPSGLSRLVMASATGEPFARTKARYELMLQANRDPDLALVLEGNSERFLVLIRDFVERMNPRDTPIPRAVLDQQAYVLTQLISGIMLAFTAGDDTITDAEELDRIMAAVVAGIAGAH
ncbi:TetR/AcrR family transcriptional regulator [Mycolicibacterium sp. P9-22]|uniref:TetR/AcrR family transcriptional regulator n=1 Tax=Mycolicibacterium sp. P9-22 TaxID=2024613 RepID=UPI001D13E0D3|nr:TetR/AcrR family transcriptional regulator [Mycolicibacterium sp. P9-22]